MDGVKAVFLGIFLIGITSSVSGLNFNVEVVPTPEADFYNSEVKEGVPVNFTVDVENSGSVGCEFRVRADVSQGEQSLERYSSSYPLWQGDTQRMQMLYLPVNYTGEVVMNFSAVYCGERKHLELQSFNSTERINPENEIASRTLEVDDSGAEVSLETESGYLVPQDYPALWKVGSSRLEDGRASLRYDPTIFRKGEEMNFTVVQDGNVTGYTTVLLEDQEKWWQELIRKASSLVSAQK